MSKILENYDKEALLNEFFVITNAEEKAIALDHMFFHRQTHRLSPEGFNKLSKRYSFSTHQIKNKFVLLHYTLLHKKITSPYYIKIPSKNYGNIPFTIYFFDGQMSFLMTLYNNDIDCLLDSL